MELKRKEGWMNGLRKGKNERRKRRKDGKRKERKRDGRNKGKKEG